MRYAARVTRHRGGRVTIRVPDIPDAITNGETEGEAIRRAQRTVVLLIRQMMIDRQPVPAPSASGEVWIELPADDAAAIERYATGCTTARYGVRSLMTALLTARKRQLGDS